MSPAPGRLTCVGKGVPRKSLGLERVGSARARLPRLPLDLGGRKPGLHPDCPGGGAPAHLQGVAGCAVTSEPRAGRPWRQRRVLISFPARVDLDYRSVGYKEGTPLRLSSEPSQSPRPAEPAPPFCARAPSPARPLELRWGRGPRGDQGQCSFASVPPVSKDAGNIQIVR